jgi:hypothetical protein
VVAPLLCPSVPHQSPHRLQCTGRRRARNPSEKARTRPAPAWPAWGSSHCLFVGSRIYRFNWSSITDSTRTKRERTRGTEHATPFQFSQQPREPLPSLRPNTGRGRTRRQHGWRSGRAGSPGAELILEVPAPASVGRPDLLVLCVFGTRDLCSMRRLRWRTQAWALGAQRRCCRLLCREPPTTTVPHSSVHSPCQKLAKQQQSILPR